ncbi:MAG TPA: DUF6282 family protein [Alphaproteobacteria bacterium]|nr:DUF6282 family protein [Alphaproteobacteria bacterium]
MTDTAHRSPRADNNNATPTMERCVGAYPARRGFKPYIQVPPKIEGVRGMIDIHCHAEYGQQDALALAKLASENGMYGILYKSIGKEDKRSAGPMEDVNRLKQDMARWSDKTGIAPIEAWGGYALTRDNKPPSREKVRTQIDAGVTSFWLPLANHAHTYSIVGGKNKRWDPSADPKAHSAPLPWELALKYGHYALDEKGKLKPEYEEAIRVIADNDRTLSFGHSTHEEIWVLAELVDKLKFKRAFIDHPFSPFVNVTVDEMKQLSRAGITFNFTYDELSPMMGVDPAKMYGAIRAVGVEHFTLSSDAGDPLFPNSVEAMRQLSSYMIAFGMNADEIETMCIRNPAKLVGLDPDEVVCAVKARSAIPAYA